MPFPKLQGPRGKIVNPPWVCHRVEVLSWQPRAFHYHNFLTPEECAHIMRAAKPQVHDSAPRVLHTRTSTHQSHLLHAIA